MVGLLPLPSVGCPPLSGLGSETEELQRRVRPHGWDVEALAPDMAVPHLELLRRDGRLKVRLQRAGRGWSIEVGFRREVVRRGYGNGPELSAVEWDEELLRFEGSTQICEIEDALSVVAAIVTENGLEQTQVPDHSRGVLEMKCGARQTSPPVSR